jgi:RNA polymerase sigma-70 factor (ECF subfamily)
MNGLMPAPPQPITELLIAWRQGDEDACDALAPFIYQELRRIARHHMRGEPSDHTLQATALANEAWVRLIDVNRVQWQDRAHFFAMASRMMRRILVDSARSRRAGKRGGGAQQVRLDSSIERGLAANQDLTVIDDALTALDLVDPRKCQVVELRFFGGLSVEETAAVLKVSAATVARDWTFARSWLKRELRARATGTRRSSRKPRPSTRMPG